MKTSPKELRQLGKKLRAFLKDLVEEMSDEEKCDVFKLEQKIAEIHVFCRERKIAPMAWFLHTGAFFSSTLDVMEEHGDKIEKLRK